MNYFTLSQIKIPEIPNLCAPVRQAVYLRGAKVNLTTYFTTKRWRRVASPVIGRMFLSPEKSRLILQSCSFACLSHHICCSAPHALFPAISTSQGSRELVEGRTHCEAALSGTDTLVRENTSWNNNKKTGHNLLCCNYSSVLAITEWSGKEIESC